MIKVEVVRKKGTTALYFETRNTTAEGLDELDTTYQALLGSEARIGGYLGSSRFVIEVKGEDQEPAA